MRCGPRGTNKLTSSMWFFAVPLVCLLWAKIGRPIALLPQSFLTCSPTAPLLHPHPNDRCLVRVSLFIPLHSALPLSTTQHIFSCIDSGPSAADEYSFTRTITIAAKQNNHHRRLLPPSRRVGRVEERWRSTPLPDIVLAFLGK